jgi:hypothetical protein
MRSFRGKAAAIAVVVTGALALAPAATAKPANPLVVCTHGCQYRTIQDAVDDSGKNATIEVEPGKYKEGVVVKGHRHDGLTIRGTDKNPRKVILEGKHAHTADGSTANHGIEGIKVDDLTLENMWARNYATNGFFIHGCEGYLMKNLLASYNRSYGLYAFDCIDGRMTRSEGYGHGDSAFYVGATPDQKGKPKWTVLDHLEAHLNVLGYSGTNSDYVEIKQSNFYDNGVGIVPNTLDSEPYEPTSNNKIHDNNIFWNNFNYFAPDSPVKTVSRGLGEIEGVGTIQFPTGVGIVLLGNTGTKVYDNQIFGHFKWGATPLSNPFNEGDNAVARDNEFTNNQMGRNGTDTNAVDFFSDGSGSGNCYSGNVSSTFDHSSQSSDAFLYPGCPAPPPPAAETGTSQGESEQFGDLASYVLTDPPEKQECSWTKHEHPKFKDYKPYETKGTQCP